MRAEIVDLIERYASEEDFTCVAPSAEDLAAVSERIGMEIPKQYVEFLMRYSHGGINGVEILGVGLDGSLAFLEETLDYRSDGLPQNYLVIENCDEWLECLDCSNGQVVAWSPYDEAAGEVHADFDTYLLSRLLDAIENL